MAQLGKFTVMDFNLLFIHNDTISQSWVVPYSEQRRKIFSNIPHIEIVGNEFYKAYESAKTYFGIKRDGIAGLTEMSDWIRLHYLMTIPKLLYSDSDVFWYYAPNFSEVAARGDVTFGIIWNGSKEISSERRENIFAYARETEMLRFVPSHLFVNRENWIPKDSFYHGKDVNCYRQN